MLNSIDKKILEVERNGGKDGKALCKLMNNAAYEKTMGNLKKGVDAKLVNNGKGYLKWASKPSYMSHKIFDNHWRQFAKNKFILTLKKPTYTGMCILELSKVYEFHYDYIKNKYCNNTVLLFTDTDSLMFEIKVPMKILATIRKCLTLVIIHLNQNIMIIQAN